MADRGTSKRRDDASRSEVRGRGSLDGDLAKTLDNLPWLHTYVLDENEKPVKANPLASALFTNAHRHVALDAISPTAEISTVFLGFDTSFGRAPQPVLWETAILDEKAGVTVVTRYTSAKQARKGHTAMLADLRKSKRGV